MTQRRWFNQILEDIKRKLTDKKEGRWKRLDTVQTLTYLKMK
jgi:hypothetical protein